MTATPYSSRLRFVDAGKLDDTDAKLDHAAVYGWGHEKLGHLDGFIGDTDWLQEIDQLALSDGAARRFRLRPRLHIREGPRSYLSRPVASVRFRRILRLYRQ